MMETLRRREAVVGASALLSLAVRLALAPRYFGWEESDYGNLAMARGVLESGFRHYDMNHLPLYYGLSAAVMGLTGDAVLATRAVALISGVLTVALATWLSDRLLGRRVAWVVGLLLAVQPELALYSASSLREPLYAALVMSALLSLTGDRLGAASGATGLAFLTRMDAVFTLGPALLLHAAGRRPSARRIVRVSAPLAATVLAWSAYCQVVHGTWRFWGHSVAVNVETGVAEAEPGLQWLLDGLQVSAALFFEVLPSRVGWGVWAGFLLALLVTPWLRHDPRRTLATASLGLLGFWLGVALIAQHDPGHNLYWKWLHAVLPPLIMLGVHGAWLALDRLRALGGAGAAWAVGLLALGQGLFAMQAETTRQLEISQSLYKPQLELAQSIEAESRPGEAMLVDNIPGCWLDRREHTLALHTWFDVPVAPGDAQAFGRWLEAEHITRVLWFQEEWTQAPVIAPWLADGRAHELGALRLVPTAREDGYGWIHYKVEPIAPEEEAP
ncbi:MAG: glycosyltransferase family 39 protein [Alphaproteobacteria bacterium]|nr:glycosyltransferase family 39 protein [Alphaproteobacteria bacterium]MCB9791638.1 glycosyltransferase family 39 protein [Alphaproteobacteria bacterium]